MVMDNYVGLFSLYHAVISVDFVKFRIYPALIIHNFSFLAIPCQLGFGVLKQQSQVLVQRNAASEIIEVDVMASCVIGVDVMGFDVDLYLFTT